MDTEKYVETRSLDESDTKIFLRPRFSAIGVKGSPLSLVFEILDCLIRHPIPEQELRVQIVASSSK